MPWFFMLKKHCIWDPCTLLMEVPNNFLLFFFFFFKHFLFSKEFMVDKSWLISHSLSSWANFWNGSLGTLFSLPKIVLQTFIKFFNFFYKLYKIRSDWWIDCFKYLSWESWLKFLFSFSLLSIVISKSNKIFI